MAGGFGTAALVFAALAIFVPVAGVAVSALACILAAIAGVSGGRALPIATALIAGINTFFLSPSLWLAQEGGPNQARSPIVLFITIAFVAVPIVGTIVGASRRADRAPF